MLVVAVLAAGIATGCDTGVPPTEMTEDTTPTVAFAAQGATLLESESPATVSVVLRNPSGNPVSVDLLYANGASTTSPSDLNLSGQTESGFVVETITFPGDAEDGATQTISFDVTDDREGEPREQAFFALQNAASSGPIEIGEPGEFRLDIGFPTLAEVRAENGDGDLVAFRGTVTRSRGSFTYLQDESNTGITVRQTGGPFRDAVAADSLQPGTQLEVSGTISFFAGLLQISGDGLSEYDILEGGSPPAPQTVTLSDLQGSGGEAYEAELVRIENMQFEAAGGTFSAGTNYTVTDDTGSLIARVPSAGDTDVAGSGIPGGTVTFVGVVGQFHGFDFEDEPDSGYQLLLIEETDLR